MASQTLGDTNEETLGLPHDEGLAEGVSGAELGMQGLQRDRLDRDEVWAAALAVGRAMGGGGRRA